MSKINLRVWIIIQAVICLSIPLFVFAILQNKWPIMLVLLAVLALSIFQFYVNNRIEEGSDERAKEIRAKIDKRIGGGFEGLCMYGGVFILMSIYRPNADPEFMVNMVKLVGWILMISVPVLELIRSVLFVIKDRE